MGLAPHCAACRRVDAAQPRGDGQGFLAEHLVEGPRYIYGISLVITTWLHMESYTHILREREIYIYIIILDEHF